MKGESYYFLKLIVFSLFSSLLLCISCYLHFFFFFFHAHLILLTACFPSSHNLAAQEFVHSLQPIMPISLMQELTITLIHPFFSRKLRNSLPASVFLPSYNMNSFKRFWRHLSSKFYYDFDSPYGLAHEGDYSYRNCFWFWLVPILSWIITGTPYPTMDLLVTCVVF